MDHTGKEYLITPNEIISQKTQNSTIKTITYTRDYFLQSENKWLRRKLKPWEYRIEFFVYFLQNKLGKVLEYLYRI